MYDPFANFTTHTLSNGVPVHVLYLPERSFAIVETIFHVGMRDDIVAPCGTAHFLEHMVCANSGKSLNELHQYFGAVGGWFNAVTSFEATRYSFMAPIEADEFTNGLDFWAQACLVKPHTDHFDREMTIIESEIKRKYPTVAMMNCDKKVQKLHFRDLPYGQAPSAAGTLESLAQINPETLLEYRQKFYTTNNLSIVCVGGISPEVLLQKLEQTVLAEGIPGLKNPAPARLTQFTPVAENDLELHLSEEKKLGQANLLIKTLFPGAVSAEVLEVAANMISELLYEEVREKTGLAYQMGVSTFHYGPMHEMTIEISSFPERNVAEVRGMVDHIISTFPQNEVLREKEKRMNLAQYLTQDYTVDRIVRAAVGELSRHGSITANAEEMKRLKSVTNDDMQFVAQHLQHKEQTLRAVVYV